MQTSEIQKHKKRAKKIFLSKVNFAGKDLIYLCQLNWFPSEHQKNCGAGLRIVLFLQFISEENWAVYCVLTF